MKVRVTGKQENQRGNGHEVSCIVTFKHVYVKVETIITDLCG